MDVQCPLFRVFLVIVGNCLFQFFPWQCILFSDVVDRFCKYMFNGKGAERFFTYDFSSFIGALNLTSVSLCSNLIYVSSLGVGIRNL